MKVARTTNAWGKPVPDAEAARTAAGDEPTQPSGAPNPYHGTVEMLKGDGFAAQFGEKERHRAVVTPLDGALSETYNAASAHDLREILLHVRQNLLAQSRQARVEVLPPEKIWYAEIALANGTVERAEAASRDQLLLTLASWQARDNVAASEAERPAPPPAHLPRWSIKDVKENVAVRDFLDLAPEYRRTNYNQLLLLTWLKEKGRPLTAKNLLAAFDQLFDERALDEHGDELDAANEIEAGRKVAALLAEENQ